MPRVTKCPLCRTKLLAANLQKSGVCIKCDESRAASKTNQINVSLEAIATNERRAELSYQRFASSGEVRRRVNEELERQKALEEEHKQMLAIHKDQASIALARRSLLHYIERRIPTYEADWVHELVAMEIERFVCDVENGKAPRLILAMPSRLGKKIANETKVLTANRGWTTHGDLQVGDYVFGLDGKPTKVVAVGPETNDIDLEIEFTNGEKIIAHRQHEWLLRIGRENYKTREWQVYETQDLLSVKWEHKNPKERSVRVPPTPRLWYRHKDLPIDPFVLSVHLGDGSTGRCRITHHRDDTGHIEEIERRGYLVRYREINKSNGAIQSYINDISGKTFASKLKELGLQHTKFVPEEYFSASITQRYDLLSGYVASDGHISKKGLVFLYSTSKRLIDDFTRLLHSLGEHPSISYSSAKTYTRVRRTTGEEYLSHEKESWCIQYKPRYEGIKTYIPRKDERLRLRSTENCSKVKSVNKVQPQKGKCIQVEATDGMYLVGETLIPTHNSELASVSAPAWILGQHPSWNIIIASYSDALPTRFSRQIREQLSSEEYNKVFPSGAVLKKDDASAKAWSTEQGGGVRATGVGSGLRGFGANILIMDDVVEDEHAANSPTVMDDVWTFATSTAYSRLMPNSGVLVIAQRLGADDLIGRFIRKMKAEEDEYNRMLTEANEYEDKGNEEEATKLRHDAKELWESMDHWRVVKYPALAVSDEYLTTDGDIVRAPEHTAIEPSWRLLRREGESIHPKRFSRYYYLNQKRANPLTFQATFQQEPISEEGAYFNASDFSRRYTPGKHPKLELCSVFCAWDLAISTATSANYTVGIAGAMDHHGDLYLLELIKGRFGDAFVISDLVIDLHKRWQAQITGIEKMMVSMTLGPVLARRMQERKEFIALAEGKDELRTGNQDKKLRARQFQALCRQGKVVTPDTPLWDEYIATMTQFGASRQDDEVDASAWLGILATRQPPPRNPALSNRPEGKPFISWYDELLAEIGGQSGSYMEA